MNILSAENLAKRYSEKILFDNLTFGIHEGDKIGLIGVNGTGKTTLLKCLIGEESLDSGKVVTRRDLVIKYLPQNPIFDENSTVLENIYDGNNPKILLLKKYENALAKLNENYDDEKLQLNYQHITEEMDSQNAWSVESEIKAILNKLGIENVHAKVGTLSGGQKRRVSMAEALIQESDLLILDEPTNHIDNEIIEWLEEKLAKRRGALLMITHDRYFLDRVTNKIIELENGKMFSFDGNYSYYLEMKAQQIIDENSRVRKQQALYNNELEWIKRGCRARSTKQKFRVNRFQDLKSSMNKAVEEDVEINVGSSRLGKKIIELKEVSKKYDKVLFENFDYTLLRDDRIGIIGKNGIGKSTLLKIISGELLPDSGEVDRGKTVKIGYYKQENVEMNNNIRVIDYIKDVAEFINTRNGEQLSASQMLELFLFDSNAQYSIVSKLSGGEKRRLYLLKVLMAAPNILILDEPTNDLDIKTLSILEDYISVFNGAVIAVSHDRYFLDKVSEKIFAFKESTDIEIHPGNYTTYLENINRFVSEEIPEKKEKKQIKKTDDKKYKFSYSEKKEFEAIDNDVELTEKELEDIEAKMESVGSDFVKLQELSNQKDSIESKLSNLYERWEYLNDLNDKISSQSK